MKLRVSDKPAPSTARLRNEAIRARRKARLERNAARAAARARNEARRLVVARNADVQARNVARKALARADLVVRLRDGAMSLTLEPWTPPAVTRFPRGT